MEREGVGRWAAVLIFVPLGDLSPNPLGFFTLRLHPQSGVRPGGSYALPVSDDSGADRAMESCGGTCQATAPPKKPSAQHGVFLLTRASNNLHLILDGKISGA